MKNLMSIRCNRLAFPAVFVSIALLLRLRSTCGYRIEVSKGYKIFLSDGILDFRLI